MYGEMHSIVFQVVLKQMLQNKLHVFVAGVTLQYVALSLSWSHV